MFRRWKVHKCRCRCGLWAVADWRGMVREVEEDDLGSVVDRARNLAVLDNVRLEASRRAGIPG